MNNSKSNNPRSFKGAGYITGAIIGFAAAITAFVITENLAISIPLLAGLTIPLGMIFEQRNQVQAKEKDPNLKRLLITLFAIGFLLLSSVVFITKLG